MCFSIPVKVLMVDKNSALIEGGKLVMLGKDLRVRQGDYLRVVGNIAVGTLSQKEGLKIRRMIKQLNEN